MANAVALTAGTKQLLKWGFADFENDGEFDGGTQTFHEGIGSMPAGVARKYIKYDGISALVEMSAGEKTTIDTAESTAIQDNSVGALEVIPIYANEAALPSTPAMANLIVCVTSDSGGNPALAMSTASTWRIIASTALS